MVERRLDRAIADFLALAPGVALCCTLAIAASLVARVEAAWLGRAWLEPVALSIVFGIALRTMWRPKSVTARGVGFAGKTVLELAVVLLGATVSIQALGATGPFLIVGIVAAVLLSVAISYAIGRALGLPRKLATLVACGNSICGNSAIAAVAPVIDADGSDVAASIAFTAVLGILIVVGLPFLAPILHLKPFAYGVLAGLTVYAVPQVVAATAPMGAIAMQIGALVKLTRVLMLGPIIACVAVLNRAFPESRELLLGSLPSKDDTPARMLPWFVIAFIAMAGARSVGLVNDQVAGVAALASAALTGLAMAALGLMVDLRVVFAAGSRVSTTAVLSILVIGLLGCVLIKLLCLG
jgi:uncharacterized integral membrane protein (TIGR00698 family)